MAAHELQKPIEDLWEQRDSLTSSTKGEARDAVESALEALDNGTVRVAEKTSGEWQVNQWLKKAVLMSFRLTDSTPMEGPGGAPVWDKVPMKFAGWGENRFKEAGFRAVPGAVVRRSAFIAPGAVLMPSFVNLGAYVGRNTMVDTWATVGSCAQIGANCHLSGGVGIGGVLEPLQANPVIIEDDCFIGARSEVAEGVIVEQGAVLSMGVFIGASTKVIDRATGEIHMGRVPSYSVVVPGSLPGKPLPDGSPGPSLYCAVIVKIVDAQTRAKTSINELLRDSSDLIDPLPLAQRLIRCNSVTPADGGSQDALAEALESLGFTIHRLRYGEIENIFARLGTEGPHFCFAGHTDVVPVGMVNWRDNPFGGEVRDGVLYGRGACDMKGAIAAFVAGVAKHLESGKPKGSISFLITGDEEGPAVDGTVKVLEWMKAHDQIPDFCLVGEPTCPVKLGDMVKIGRRGSVNFKIEVHGTQGHVAYPQRADNPVHRLVSALQALTAAPIDAGTEWFEPSTLGITSVDVGNTATNVIPPSARAMMNIRFNEKHTGASLIAWVKATLAKYAERVDVEASISGESFVTKPGPMVDILRQAIVGATGVEPKLDTGGGTSDARFIANYCPVAEFGLVGATMHQTNERVPVAELRDLARIYHDVIAAFLA